MAFGTKSHTIGAMATQRVVSGLTWIAKHTRAATTSLALSLAMDEDCASSAAINPLVAAVSDFAQLSNLSSLVFSAYPFEEGGSDLVLVRFLDWLLEEAPKLKTVFLRVRTRHLPASHITFQHMRHLVMPSHGIQRHLLVAEQLPALEVLCVYSDDTSDMGLEVLDMSRCKRLRQLVLSDFVAQQLIWDATDNGPCPLTFKLQNSFRDFAEGCPDALNNQAALARQIVLWSHDGTDGYAQGMSGIFPQTRILLLDWPPGFEPDWADEDDVREEAGGLLSWCMPAGGQPLLHLQTIIIKAFSMDVTCPSAAQLPNLRELVVTASGCMGLHFQDPVGTITWLSSLHVFGRPLVPHGWDMVKLMAASGALEERGLVLGAAATEQHGPKEMPTSCLYLRPIGARELSIDELCAQVEQCAQCRCEGCLGCLARAGYLDT